MNQNVFTRMLSYLTEIQIEFIQSDYNTDLQVLLKNGRYQLCTPHAIYSYADKYDNFRLTFERLKLETNTINNVLLLGFGLGSIPYMLELKFGKKYTYTGVEIDEAVIYLASKYVMDELKSEIELIHVDAHTFISQNKIKYDLICIDIFIDDKIPEIFLTKEFLHLTSESLSKNGCLLFNHLAHNVNDISQAKNYFNDMFSKVFTDGTYLDVNKNMMMVSHAGRWIKRQN